MTKRVPHAVTEREGFLQRESPKRSQRNEVLYIKGIPADIKLQFKAACARRGYSMTDVIIKAMKSLVKEDATVGQAE